MNRRAEAVIMKEKDQLRNDQQPFRDLTSGGKSLFTTKSTKITKKLKKTKLK